MKTSHIDNLAQLREAKLQLKQKMAEADIAAKDNIIYSFLNKLFAKKKNKDYRKKLGDGPVDAINFVAHQEKKKIDYGKILQSALSVGVLIAAPIIAKKIQK